jgi:YggT family protein
VLQQIVSFLVDTAAVFFVYLLLARFHFQWLAVPFRNQVGEFVVITTNWIVRPARRVIPPLGGLDLATAVAAWLLQAVALYALFALRGGDLGSAPGAALALLASVALVDLFRFSVYMLVFAVLVQAILSWVAPHAASSPVLDAVTRPFLRPVRRLLPPIANIDLSPLLLLILLQVLLFPIWSLRAAIGGIF